MILPQSVTLLSRGSQQFSEHQADQWALSPALGRLDAKTGLYQAPWNVWISRTVDVIALAGGREIGRASVMISSARNWMAVLGFFWTAFSILLLGGLFVVWPPPAEPPFVGVYPLVATLQPSDTLQFLSSAAGSGKGAVLWTASAGQITPSGVFTALASLGPISVSAMRESDRTQTATAQVYIHPKKKLVMERSVVDASSMPAGAKIEFHALGPDGAENGLRWYLSGPGSLSGTGVYTIRDKSARQAVVTAVDPMGGRQAAAVVELVSGLAASDKRLLLLVVIMGAFGALLGAMRSFVNYVGSRTFVPSWGFYYFSRPLFGAGLALIVFFAYRIGAIAGPQGATSADPFAAAFVAGLVGLFADTVLQKLQELITQLFRPADTRTDKMTTSLPAPQITALAVNQGVLTVTGANFSAGATVSVNGGELHPSSVNAGNLSATIPVSLSTQGTKLDVFVVNADGGKSSTMSVTI
jgi:hypothetical protein